MSIKITSKYFCWYTDLREIISLPLQLFARTVCYSTMLTLESCSGDVLLELHNILWHPITHNYNCSSAQPGRGNRLAKKALILSNVLHILTTNKTLQCSQGPVQVDAIITTNSRQQHAKILKSDEEKVKLWWQAKQYSGTAANTRAPFASYSVLLSILALTNKRDPV